MLIEFASAVAVAPRRGIGNLLGFICHVMHVRRGRRNLVGRGWYDPLIQMSGVKGNLLPRTVTEHCDAFAAEYDGSTEWCSDPTLTSALTAGVAGKRVLDLGCGTGLLLDPLRGGGAAGFGLDLSMSMLAQASSTRGTRFAQGRAELLPFASGSFGLVISRQLLHYTREAEVLCDVRRVLEPGGEFRLAQVTSMGDADYSFWAVLKALLQPLRRRYYTAEFLLTLVELCGFRVTSVRRHSVRRRYGIDELFNRSPLDAARREHVVSWIGQQMEALPEELEASFDDGAFTINQYWTVLAAAREA